MRFPKDREFLISKEDEIKKGLTTDIYFIRTEKILRSIGKLDTNVKMEISSGGLPKGFGWGVLAGVPEVLNLFKDMEMDLYMMREGTIFKPRDDNGYRTPIGYLVGKYGVFGKYETPLLGLLCQASGIATYSAHIRLAAWGKVLLSFGARRMHPAITPLIDYAAYIAGFDGVSAILSAELLGLEPQGTMPHALILIVGDQVKAWKAFDKYMSNEVPRIALVDTFSDEKVESIMAVETLGNRIYGVRLDTPGSRRGDIKDIIREVRWELDIRGYREAKIFLSGGVDLELIKELDGEPVDGYGIGSSLSNARIVDYALDIVEMDGNPIAKRGKYSGTKALFRCRECYTYIAKPWKIGEGIMHRCPKCGEELENLYVKILDRGRITVEFKEPREVRRRVMDQLKKIRELGWGD